MSGISGSGKSTKAKQLIDQPSWAIVSADFYFENDSGEYIFDASELGDAHAECMRYFVKHVIDRVQLIVVDNTNTRIEEIAPYYQVAKAYRYDVEIVCVESDVEKCIMRNVHGVPADVIRKQARNIQSLMFNMPKHWKYKVVMGDRPSKEDVIASIDAGKYIGPLDLAFKRHVLHVWGLENDPNQEVIYTRALENFENQYPEMDICYPENGETAKKFLDKMEELMNFLKSIGYCG